jgi:hypothetical protein
MSTGTVVSKLCATAQYPILSLTQGSMIYLDKRGSNFDNDWAYYRITSEGGMGDPIELCLVKWPTLE